MSVARIVLSEDYPGMFLVTSDDPFGAASACRPGDLAPDGTVLNPDRLGEVCDQLADAGFSVSLSRGAADRWAEVHDETPFETPSLRLPEGFALKAFQNRCLNSLRREPRAMVQSSPGTGKTVVGVSLSTARLDAGEVGRIAVFCPSALVGDWVRAFRRFTSLKVGTPDKSRKPAERAEWYLLDDSDVWVMNYERLRTQDYEPVEKALAKARPMFVLDEVTKVKTRSSTLHARMAKLVRRSEGSHVLALTATPIVTGPEDFYNEWRIIDQSKFGLVRDFEEDFTYNCGEKDFWGKYVGYVNLEYMRARVGAQMFSADKSSPEIAREFPQKHEIPIEVELSRDDRHVYDALFDVGDGIDPEERQGSLFAMLLQRLCNMPEALANALRQKADEDTLYGRQLAMVQRVIEDTRRRWEGSKSSNKLEAATEKVDELLSAGERVIVFGAQTDNLLFPLARHWKAWSPLLYVGGMGQGELDEVSSRFKSGERRLLLMSDAGQMGLNFQECRNIVHYQTPVTHAAYVQRSDRVHRIDSEFDSVDVYRFITLDTIEERVEATMQGRRRVSEEMGLSSEYEEFGPQASLGDADFFCGFSRTK